MPAIPWYPLATLGIGDFYPAKPFWRIFTVTVALSGFSLLTIAITYLIQLLTSEIDKRKLSLYIASIGTTPQDILMNGCDGKTFRRLGSHFISLSPMILSHSQHYLAYPILHQFTSHRPLDATAFTLTALTKPCRYCIFTFLKRSALMRLFCAQYGRPLPTTCLPLSMILSAPSLRRTGH